VTARPTRARVEIPILLLGMAALVSGWKVFWFLCDDAFIAFRYISNSILGHGYVWNPPPFFPVEGYTSFLWIVLLDGVWRVMGVEPPDSANYISLLFSLATLLLTTLMVQRLTLTPRLERFRPALLALVLLGCVSNRTFLAWSSSGLETALFNFLLTLWVFRVLSTSKDSGTAHYSVITGVSALIYLARPDGMLFLAASVALVLHWLVMCHVRGRVAMVNLVALLPVLVFAAHMIWRHSFYGEWLPNTYYAKHVTAWPQAGARYALSFALEYAYWLWIGVALLFIGRCIRHPNLGAIVRHPANATAVVTLATHFSFKLSAKKIPTAPPVVSDHCVLRSIYANTARARGYRRP